MRTLWSILKLLDNTFLTPEDKKNLLGYQQKIALIFALLLSLAIVVVLLVLDVVFSTYEMLFFHGGLVLLDVWFFLRMRTMARIGIVANYLVLLLLAGTFFYVLQTQQLVALSGLLFVPSTAILLLGLRWGGVWFFIAAGSFACVLYNLDPSSKLTAAIHLLTDNSVVFFVLMMVFTTIPFLISVFYELSSRLSLDFVSQEKINAEKISKQLRQAENTARQSLNDLESMMENIPLPVWFKDTAGRYSRCNAAFTAFLGIPKEQILGQLWLPIHPEETRADVVTLDLDLIASGGSTSFETRILHADGTYHDVFVFKSSIMGPDHRPVGLSATAVDVTLSKQKEREWSSLMRTREKLFAMIGHDLRAPVTKIQQFLVLYEEERQTFDPPTWDLLFADMRQSADSLHALLENLFLWSRGQMGSLVANPEHLDLKKVVADVFQLYRTAAVEKEITFESELLVARLVFLDLNMISTILRNLVGNALKFTPRGGRIKIRATDDSECGLSLYVSDSGIGIEPDHLVKIFLPGELTIRYGTEKEKGTGFGLSLCRDLASAMGGRLSVTSEVGQGSTFRLDFEPRELVCEDITPL